jgi:hypothetical protein
MADARDDTRIQGLEELIATQARSGTAPVEKWDPPYRGDIGLAIKADGTWLYQGTAIVRPALVKLFARVLRRDADGRTYLVTPAEKVDVVVDDAPFLAVEMEVRGEGPDQEIVFRTNVDDIVLCGPEHPLRFEQAADGGLKPYVRVRGRLDALLTRALTYDLVECALACDAPQDKGAGDQPGVWSGGVFFPVRVG